MRTIAEVEAYADGVQAVIEIIEDTPPARHSAEDLLVALRAHYNEVMREARARYLSIRPTAGGMQ